MSEPLFPDCHLRPNRTDAGCWWCGSSLPPRRRRWCRDECRDAFRDNHYWTFARYAAVVRDGNACRRCGRHYLDESNVRYMQRIGSRVWPERWSMEVNHRIPRNGEGYAPGCHHHLVDLETLCHACHVAETNRQRGHGEHHPQREAEPLALGL